MLVDSSEPIVPIQVADEPDVFGHEVPRLCDSLSGKFSSVGLIEEPTDGFDSDDSLRIKTNECPTWV